ncbi:MAG: hypothetical protein JXL80_16780, partial [Planctomycetes bacterium]|nr:hypothetical protein [Planctomycetota bacterium]
MARRRYPPAANVVTVDALADAGPLETWRHALGHGGINSVPLPDAVVEGATLLRPRLIRIFIQEFFTIYRGSGRFDWSRLDPYMDALDRTGAKVVAAITIKPKALFPQIDAAQWRPRDVAEWQNVVAQLVRRYSVERAIVTHWEIGNEPDIGEDGGCPYLITRPEDYAEYYAMTVAPILETFPAAKVGGPGLANAFSDLLPGLIRHCARTALPLDFVSWHLYHSDPALHAALTRHTQILLADYPGKRPEIMVTEFNRRLAEPVAAEDHAQDPRRAASLAAILLAHAAIGLDWSFYYHLWDQTCYHEDFANLFSPRGLKNMVRHWNEVPHRLGLFGVDGRVRPQYFVYRMLQRLGERRLAATTDGELGVMAGRSDAGPAVMLVNYSIDQTCDRG